MPLLTSGGPARRRSVRGSGARRTTGAPRWGSRRRARASRGPGCPGNRAAPAGSSRPLASAGPVPSSVSCSVHATCSQRRLGPMRVVVSSACRTCPSTSSARIRSSEGSTSPAAWSSTEETQPVETRAPVRSATSWAYARPERAGAPGGRPPGFAGSGRRRSATRRPARGLSAAVRCPQSHRTLCSRCSVTCTVTSGTSLTWRRVAQQRQLQLPLFQGRWDRRLAALAQGTPDGRACEGQAEGCAGQCAAAGRAGRCV